MSIVIGDFPSVSTIKSVQASKCVSTQDVKDSGRTQFSWWLNGIFTSNGPTSGVDTIALLGGTSVNYVQTLGTTWPYTVTAGKILRLQYLYAAVSQLAGTAALNNTFLRVRVTKPGFTATGVNNTINAIVGLLSIAQPSATNGSIGSGSLFFQDGIEIPGGYQLSVSWLAGGTNTTNTTDYILTGYEY